MDSIIIEQLAPQDLEQVLALHETILPFPVSTEHAREIHNQILSDENYAILVAKRGAEVLGTVTAVCCKALATNFMVLEDFVVKPGHTGNGIGGKLMDAADNFARSRHCTYAILVSSGFRKDAHRFYEKHGFFEDVRGFRKGY